MKDINTMEMRTETVSERLVKVFMAKDKTAVLPEWDEFYLEIELSEDGKWVEYRLCHKDCEAKDFIQRIHTYGISLEGLVLAADGMLQNKEILGAKDWYTTQHLA